MSKRQIIAILMLSPFYFSMSVRERRAILNAFLKHTNFEFKDPQASLSGAKS